MSSLWGCLPLLTLLVSGIFSPSLPSPPTPVSEISTWDLLAYVIWSDAWGESHDGKELVGVTVRSRVRYPHTWGQGWRGVMLFPGAFSVSKKISLPQKSDSWQDCREIAGHLLAGKPTEWDKLKPTHFFSPDKGPAPYWTKLFRFATEEGGHRFYSALRK